MLAMLLEFLFTELTQGFPDKVRGLGGESATVRH